MNEQPDPCATTDHPAKSPGSGEALRTTDHVPPSAGIDGSPACADAPANDLPAVPGYRVLREIARGGMGCVLAASDLTLDRDVALKVLLPGANADRFVRESKITARLPHPGIPPVHALGTLSDGSPFLAMKLIAGRTLADEMKSADRPRLLQAFTQVCQAVGFAHSRGIIHRDLKPANVMVGAFGEVQVMDWGLAKDRTSKEPDDAPRPRQSSPAPVVGADPGATTDHHGAGESTDEETQAGQVLGTPAYLAPEQARGEATDARSDVFALGGILCAILTGKPTFAGSSTAEVIRRAAAADLAEVDARLERCEADEELVALCRRCLSPRPDNRPANGQVVADELMTYLGGVQEKLRRAELAQAAAQAKAIEEAKRRRLTLALGGTVVLVLVIGIVSTIIGLVRAEDRRIEADNARADEEVQRRAAVKAKEQTEKRLTQIEKGVELFAGLLKGINPKSENLFAPALYEQLRERAEKVSDQLHSEAIGDPLAEARLQTILGDALAELGSHKKAVEILERARATRQRELPADHPDTLATVNSLGGAYRRDGRTKEAVTLFEKLRDKRLKTLGPNHRDTLVVILNLAGAYEDAGRLREAIPLYEQVNNAAAKNPFVGTERNTMINNLALAYRKAGRTTDAIRMYNQAREASVRYLGPDHSTTLMLLSNLGFAYAYAGRQREAIPLLERVQGACLKKLGPDHPTTLSNVHSLATAYRAAGRFKDSIHLLEEVHDACKKKLGPDDPTTLTVLDNLATKYARSNRLADAIPLLEHVRDVKVKTRGADHSETLETRNSLANAYSKAGRFADAITLLKQVCDASAKNLGADHPSSLRFRGNLAVVYWEAGRQRESITLLEQVRDDRARVLGPNHLDTLATVNDLAEAYLKTHRLAEALPLFEHVREQRVKQLGPEHLETIKTINLLANAYAEAGRLAEAISMFEKVRVVRERELGADHLDTLNTIHSLAATYWRLGRSTSRFPCSSWCWPARKKRWAGRPTPGC
jgi:tetratricopeptide (TPR) repeat protein